MLSFKRHGQYIIYDIMAFLYSNNYKKKKNEKTLRFPACRSMSS